jgi:hypothetical protein
MSSGADQGAAADGHLLSRLPFQERPLELVAGLPRCGMISRDADAFSTAA